MDPEKANKYFPYFPERDVKFELLIAGGRLHQHCGDHAVELAARFKHKSEQAKRKQLQLTTRDDFLATHQLPHGMTWESFSSEAQALGGCRFFQVELEAILANLERDIEQVGATLVRNSPTAPPYRPVAAQATYATSGHSPLRISTGPPLPTGPVAQRKRRRVDPPGKKLP
jgi:hypothetical protein